MKVAKATPEEFPPVQRFINRMESLLKPGRFRSSEEDWRDWDDDDEDKNLLLEIEEELRETEQDEEPDNRIVLFEYIKRKWNEANRCGSFGRIVMDAAVLIDNVCDPALDYLEYRPEMLEAFKTYNETHEEKIEH